MGFSGMDHLLRAQTVLDDREVWDMEKTPITAGALTSLAYYDLFEAGTVPATNTLPTGSSAFLAARANSGVPQLGGVNINALAFTVPSGSKTRHLTFMNNNGGSIANCHGNTFLLDLVGIYPDFDLAAGGTQATGTGVGVADVTRHTDGKNLFMYVVVQTTLTGTAPTIQINYTTGGLASVSTAAIAILSGSVRGRIATSTVFKIPFGSNDPTVVAVRSVTFAGGAAPTGLVSVFIAKEIGLLVQSASLIVAEKSFVDPSKEFSAPKWDDDAVPNLVFRPSSTPSSPSIGYRFHTTKGYAT
jgi:hypothetical protein